MGTPEAFVTPRYACWFRKLRSGPGGRSWSLDGHYNQYSRNLASITENVHSISRLHNSFPVRHGRICANLCPEIFTLSPLPPFHEAGIEMTCSRKA